MKGTFTTRGACVRWASVTSSINWFVVIGYADGSFDWSQPGKAAPMPCMADNEFTYRRAHLGKWRCAARKYGQVS